MAGERLIKPEEEPGNGLTVASDRLFGWGVGDELQYTKEITPNLVRLFAELSGDKNPLHLDAEYAKRTRFGNRIAHGILPAALISAVISMMSSKECTAIYVRQELGFFAPVYIGDNITAKFSIEQVMLNKRKLILDTNCTNQEGVRVVAGNATVILDPHPYPGMK